MLDFKEILFAFSVKAKDDEGLLNWVWNKLKSAAETLLNFLSGGSFGKWSIGRANNQKLDIIAKICVNYNRYLYYNALHNNCQHFVKKILKEIGSDFNSEGEFGYIIKELEEKGKIDFIFKGHNFRTRKELDEYVKNINFHSLCDNDKKLLICYKNTFDIYLTNDPNNLNYQTTEESKQFWKKLITNENFRDN